MPASVRTSIKVADRVDTQPCEKANGVSNGDFKICVFISVIFNFGIIISITIIFGISWFGSTDKHFKRLWGIPCHLAQRLTINKWVFLT